MEEGGGKWRRRGGNKLWNFHRYRLVNHKFSTKGGGGGGTS